MAARPSYPRTGAFAPLEQRFARQILVGVALLGLMAVAGPLLSYDRDSAEVHRIFHQRVSREAGVYAAALASHFRMLEAELERLAARPEIDFADQTLDPERELLSSAHEHSALFQAVALLNPQGVAVWSEPKDALAGSTPLGGRDWFQKVLALQRPVVNAIAPHDSTFVVAAPILRHGHLTGVLVGLLDASSHLLPGGQAVDEGFELVVINREGDVFVPRSPAPWTRSATFLPTVESLVASGRAEGVAFGQHARAMAATEVGETGLRLALMADEAAVIAPMRRSFLWQLLFLAVLQSLTVLLFAVYLRSNYRAFMRLEASATQQEKLAALGSAASLIAHEVKNSLNGLKAAASLLETGEPPALPVRSLRGQIDRLGHLASSLLHFGKPASAQLVPAELNHLVRDALEGLKSLPEADDALVTTDFGPPIQVRCDPLLLITALDNLIRNAIEAAVVAKDLGRIIEPRVLVRVGHHGALARVQVEDNAGGPPEGFEQQLFQPFVTSKPKGIGLGLSMARQALEKQGGTLHFERTRQGSLFTVELARED